MTQHDRRSMSLSGGGRGRSVRVCLAALPWLVALCDAGAAPGPIGSQLQVNSYTTGTQGYPAVAATVGGGFVVVWHSTGSNGTDTSDYSIQGQRYDGSGTPLGGEFQVNTYTTDRQVHPAVAQAGAGGFVVVWHSTGSNGTDTSFYSIHGQRYDASGAPLGGEFQVNTHTPFNQTYPRVATASGGFVVTWQSFHGVGADTSGWAIEAQRYDATGVPVGAEFQVNTYTTGDQERPRVGATGAGTFAIVWESFGSAANNGQSVLGQRYDASGVPAGGEFQVNTYTLTSHQGAAVAPDGAGGFVVAWDSASSFGPDFVGRSVQGQRYDAVGVPTGTQFQVNAFSHNNQRSADVVPDGAGGFVVVWFNAGATSSDPTGSVMGQVFDATGSPAGGEFQVNTYTAGAQALPAIAADEAGGFVVAFVSVGSSGSDNDGGSIQVQRYEGGAFATTTVTSTTTSTATIASTTSTSTSTTTSTTTLPPTVDSSIPGTKLVVVDRASTPAASAKIVSVSKVDAGIQKGAPLAGGAVTPPGLTGALDVGYVGCGAAAIEPDDPCPDAVPSVGHFSMPPDWLVNKPTVAKYVNRTAPIGGEVKVAVVKPSKVAKVVAKGLGEGPALDLAAAGKPGASGVIVILTVENESDGNTYRMCTRYAPDVVRFKVIAAGLGRKLVARGGLPVPCP